MKVYMLSKTIVKKLYDDEDIYSDSIGVFTLYELAKQVITNTGLTRDNADVYKVTDNVTCIGKESEHLDVTYHIETIELDKVISE